MSDLSQVRSLISDPYRFEQASFVDPNGTDTRYNLDNYPVLDGSETVYVGGSSTTAYTIDNGTGTITFDTAPTDDIVVAYKFSILSDDAITDFLDVGGSVLVAAALALRAIAVNQLLLFKVVKFLDLQTDGASMARALTDLAAKYEAVVDAEVAWDIAQQIDTDFGFRELFWKEVLSTL